MPSGYTNKPRLDRRLTRPTGNGDVETITVAEAICREIETTGRSPGNCAHAGDVDDSTVNLWLREARALADRALRGAFLDRREQALTRFLAETKAAKNRWVAENLRLHRQIADGGLTTAEVVEQVDPHDIVERQEVQPDGNLRTIRGPRVLNRRVKTTRLLPDVRALEWEMDRLAKDEFAQRVEITDATTDDDSAERALDLAADAEKFLAREADAYSQGVEDGRAREGELEDEGADDL